MYRLGDHTSDFIFGFFCLTCSTLGPFFDDTRKEYDLVARLTIRYGRKFKFRDHHTNQARVGYFDATRGVFTATSQQGKDVIIHTHFPMTWEKIRSWAGLATID